MLDGQLIGLPTETVYGLAGRGDDALAVESIFAAKGRPHHNPLILHVADASDARQWLADDLGEVLQNRFSILQRYWPGPLTLIGPKHSRVLDQVTAGGSTVALRIPDHPVALALLNEMKRQHGIAVPVAAPSANLSNYVSPTTAAHVANGLGDRVSMILDGGPCRVGLESTIVFLGTPDTPPRVLRSGQIDAGDLADRLGEPVIGPQNRLPVVAPEPDTVAAPGQFAKHYSPHKPVALLPLGTQWIPKQGVLRIDFVADDDHDRSPAHWTFAADGRLETAAANLYRVLRDADASAYQRIEIVACPEMGIGIAIMDRLRRSAS